MFTSVRNGGIYFLAIIRALLKYRYEGRDVFE